MRSKGLSYRVAVGLARCSIILFRRYTCVDCKSTTSTVSKEGLATMPDGITQQFPFVMPTRGLGIETSLVRFVYAMWRDMHCSCKNGSCQLKEEHRGILESMSTDEFDEWRARFPSCGRTCVHRGKFRAYKEAFNKVRSLIWRQKKKDEQRRKKKDEEDEEG